LFDPVLYAFGVEVVPLVAPELRYHVILCVIH